MIQDKNKKEEADEEEEEVWSGAESFRKKKTLSDAGNRTRAAWVRTRNPNH